MPISFTCPHCSKSMTVADNYAGMTGPCRECGRDITIPGAFSSPPVTSQAPPKSSKTLLFVILGFGALALLAIPAVLVALLLPAVNAAREASRRSICINQMRQIEIALLNYESNYGHFPPAYTVDENGNKLHSWRVLILPFLEENHIYDQIDLSKPWDDPDNAILSEYMPEIYRCPSSPIINSLMTHYVTAIGAENIFSGPTPTKVSEVKDGLSSTIMFVESSIAACHWAAPDDPDTDTLLMSLGSDHSLGYNVAFADGSIQFFSNDTPQQQVGASLTRDGNEVVTMP